MNSQQRLHPTQPWFLWLACLFLLLFLPQCQCPDVPTTPDASKERRGDTQISTEPSPEPTQDTKEPKPEPRPEPSLEPKPEPRPEPATDGSEPMQDEPVVEVKPEPQPDQGGGSIIGAACKTDADCGGTPYRCIKESEMPRFPFPADSGKGPPGGYCTKACYGNDTMCPTDAACYIPGAAAGACMKRCNSDSDCRSKYSCKQGMAMTKVCTPPECSLKEPKGLYTVILNQGRLVSGSGACQPLKAGTKVTASLEVKAGQLNWEFGSKPGSPLPVTWRLEGGWSKIGDKHKAVSGNNDGSVEGRFNNGCLFYGTLLVTMGKCKFSYDITVHTR